VGAAIGFDGYLIRTAVYLAAALWLYVLASLVRGRGIGEPEHGSRVVWIVVVGLLPLTGLAIYLLVGAPRRSVLELLPAGLAAVAAAVTGAVLDALFFVGAICVRGADWVSCSRGRPHDEVVAWIALATAGLVLFLTHRATSSPAAPPGDPFLQEAHPS